MDKRAPEDLNAEDLNAEDLNAEDPDPSPEDRSVALPLNEETLTVERRPVETGRVRVATVVHEHSETVSQLLRHEQAEIRRIPRNVPVSTMPHVRQDGETIILPVVEEVLVVEKRLVLKEEIHISKRTTTIRNDTPVTLRKEDVVIERNNSGPNETEQPSPNTQSSTQSAHQSVKKEHQA